MVPLAHCTPFPAAVYWDCWLTNKGAPAWRIRLFCGPLLGYRGPDLTCYRAEQLIGFVAAHDRVYAVCISANTHPATAEHLARRLMAAGLVAFSPFTAPFDQA